MHISIYKELHSIRAIDSHGIADGTLWWTVLGLPIFPIATYRVQFFPPRHDTLQYRLLTKKSLDTVAILMTYLNAVFVLFLLVFPLCFLSMSIAHALGLPYIQTKGNIVAVIVYLLWIVGIIVAVGRNHVGNGTP